MALTDNLVAAWELNEASGNALDSHGSNTLTDNNTVGSGTGLVYGTARDFEAANGESFSIADNADVSVGDVDCTWEAWVKLESKTNDMFVLAKNNASDGDYILEYNQGADRFRLRVFGAAGFGSTTTLVANTFGSPSLATWYHVVAWHDSVNNLVGITINDGTPDTAAHSTGIFDSSAPLHIGNAAAFAQPWDGLIAPVRFWKRALTSAEITELYNAGAGLPYASFGGGGVTVTPTTAALTLTTFAPTVSTPRLVTPATASLVLATFAPTVATPRTATPSPASLALTGFAPTVNTPRLVTPSTLALSLSAFAPTVTTTANRLVTPGTLALSLAAFAPTVATSTGATPRRQAPAVAGQVARSATCGQVTRTGTWGY